MFRPLQCKPSSTAPVLLAAVLLGGCASQLPPPQHSVSPQPGLAQQASAPPQQPRLKRRIALGRVTNETAYGRPLLADERGDAAGKQVSDMLARALTASGDFVVLERTDLAALDAERTRAGLRDRLPNVDVLLFGALTSFGRKTEGKTGFVSATKRQTATAGIDLRVVDIGTGQNILAVAGAGEASTETAVTFGFGTHAAYDATLDDNAIRAAVADAVNRLVADLAARPWQTAIVAADKDGSYFLAGGKSQGLRPGMRFSVQTVGPTVKAPQTGFAVTLPGKEVAQLRIDSLFGDSDTNGGARSSLVAGSLQGMRLDQLVVREAVAP